MPKVSELPDRLEAERVVVRRYQKGDGKALFALLERNNNRAFLHANVEEVASLATVRDTESKVQRHAAEWTARERFVMGIWLKSDLLFVGRYGLNRSAGKFPPLNWDGF